MKFTLAILAFAAVVTADDWSSATPSNPSNSSGSYSSTATPSPSSTAYNSTATSGTTSSAAAAAYNTPTVAIPSSASEGCKNFLDDLNSSPAIQSCLAPAVSAATAKSPSITTFCSAASSQGCSETTMRAWLTSFGSNCSAELVTNPNKDVRSIYDSMYVSLPLSHAICAKDTSGDYCLSNLASNATAKAASGINNAAQQPLSATDGTPDADVFTAANILFMGANANMTAAQLCTECTKNVLTSYFSFESTTAYAGGLASSPLLGPQSALYSAVSTTCGAAFLSGALANAGSTPNTIGGANNDNGNNINGAITFSPATGLVALVALAGGFMTL